MLFPFVIVLGSFLLFLIEPIAAKQLLPLLGGSAAVWTACLVFFQTVLLLGYLCAHVLATRLTLRQQSLVFLGLLCAALVQLVATTATRDRAAPRTRSSACSGCSVR